MRHHCHARGCDVATKPTMLMCARHWHMVPHHLQLAVWKAYRRGQCDDKSPSDAWREAAARAIDFVAKSEAIIAAN